ncbi:MAG: adenylate/guanylate cyclase domain-containing protein, partial [Actinobacteria bacterium]|nr:adenylate/guanylate cyclase domain-containing protein [Actinomycetota bacterium]
MRDSAPPHGPSGTDATITITLLFTDIVGSTERWERSPEMSGLVDRHFEVLRDEVAGAGGAVFAEMGDGIAAAFDSTGAALRAALGSQLRLADLGLGVRMGIHTGEVVRAGDDYRGRAVNRAARIMTLARGGQVLISDVTATLLRSGAAAPGFDLADVGVHELRGMAEPERVWQLVHPGLEMRSPEQTSSPCAPDGCWRFPTPRTSLVGRSRDRRLVADRLRAERIVTLSGVGGVGKTRLAIEVAGHQPGFDLVELVPLAGLSPADDVGAAIAGVLGATIALDPCDAVVAAIGSKPALLVLDNCEHVIDRAAEVVDALIARCRNLHVLATSREPLAVDGEHVITVRPLATATDAIELFRQRASAAGADLDDVPRALVEQLCEQLDGLPLAIELAAARAATLGIGEIAEAIAADSTLLAATRRRHPHGHRHASLDAAISWSYRLMTDDEQRLFRWMAAFPGGFELDAARHVGLRLGLDARSIPMHIESLVAKNMLDHDRPALGARGAVRYRMLDTMRAFAVDQLDAADERIAAAAAMAHWVASIAGPEAPGPCSEIVERCSIRLERELDNWRESVAVAVRLGSSELAGGLCGPAANFALLGRHDLAELVRPLLGWCARPVDRQAVLAALIVSTCGTAEPDQLWQWATEVQAIDDDRHDGPTGLGGLMRWLALAWRGEFDASIAVCLEAADDARLHRSTRDLFVGIAVLDRFSLTAATPVDPATDPLVQRAYAVAGGCEMALARISCLLGVAWASVEADPAWSIELVGRALEHIADVPPLTRLTLPGSASRLLTRLEPGVAARALLDRIDERDVTPGGAASFTEMIPLFYGAALLERVGDPAAAPTLATVTS